MGERLTHDFLSLFCEKNSDGTKKLRLKGNELQQRIQNRLSDNDVPKIVNFLKQNPEIIDLNLCYNNINDEGFSHLCENYLSFPNSLQYLNVIKCGITEYGMKTLYNTFLLDFVDLKILRLAGNKIGPIGGNLLALMISHSPSMEYLDVGDTDQTPDSIDNLILTLPFTQLRILNISRIIPDNCGYQYDPKLVAGSLSEFLRLSKTIWEVHAQKIGFDGHDIEIIVEGLEKNKSLKLLDVAYNNYGDHGGELLANFLKTRPNLIALNMAGSKLRDSAATAIGLNMPFSKLRLLDISYNLIPNSAMVFILNSIKKPYMLRYFYCWGNEIKHEACKRIQRMLLTGVFEQENLDVKIYCVDHILYAARYPSDHYKHRYYEVMDHGCATELKIKRNKIETPNDLPRALIKFQHIDRYPPL